MQVPPGHPLAHGPDTWEGNGRHYNTETHSGTLGGDARTITTDWAPVNWLSGSPSGGDGLAEPLQPAHDDPGLLHARRVLRLRHRQRLSPRQLRLRRGPRPRVRELPVQRRPRQHRQGVHEDVRLALDSRPERIAPETYPSFPGSVGMDGDMFGKDFTYQNGQLVSAGWIKGSGAPPFLFRNLTRDATTGWITGSTDSAGLTTTYRTTASDACLLIDPPRRRTCRPSCATRGRRPRRPTAPRRRSPALSRRPTRR